MTAVIKPAASDKHAIFSVPDKAKGFFMGNVYWDFKKTEDEVIITHCQVLALNMSGEPAEAIIECAHNRIRAEHNGCRSKNIVTFDCKTQLL